jgi:hypothetical protein
MQSQGTIDNEINDVYGEYRVLRARTFTREGKRFAVVARPRDP